MHLTAIVPVYNEERILPFFLDYYTTFCDYIVFYDGCSTDNSRNIIMDYMNRGLNCEIELRVNRTVGTVDVYSGVFERCPNLSLHYVRTHGWRSLFCHMDVLEWVAVVDCDEFLWHPMGVRQKLERYKAEGIAFPSPSNIQMISHDYPQYTDECSLIKSHTQGYIDKSFEGVKRLAFDTTLKKNYSFKEFGYRVPDENTRDDEPIIDRLKVLHYAKLGYDHYVDRTRFKGSRVSDHNKQFGLSYHYAQDFNITLNEFNSFFNHPGFVSDIHNQSTYPPFVFSPHEVRERPKNSLLS